MKAGIVCLAVLTLSGCLGPSGPDTMRNLVALDDGATSVASATVPVILDSQRLLVEIDAIRPDGTTRKVLAWVNMGMSSPVLSKRLYRDLQIDKGRSLELRVGAMPIVVKPDAITDGPGRLSGEDDFEHFFAPYPVEAILSAGILQNFEVVLDYPARRLTLARPSTLKPDGIPVPFRLKSDTGLITVDARIGDETHAIVVDAGAGYSWFRGTVVAELLQTHPDWYRAEGAVGQSNNAMLDYAFEKRGTLVRIPEIDIADLRLREVGVLGTGPLLGAIGDKIFGNLFWDTWQKSATQPVAGWLGGNLRNYRVTVDYAARTLYWKPMSEPDVHDLDQVGIVLVRRSGEFFVGGIAQKHGVLTVAGLEIGDQLVAVDGLAISGLTKDRVVGALHGSPGQHHRLSISRSGAPVEIDASVSAF